VFIIKMYFMMFPPFDFGTLCVFLRKSEPSARSRHSRLAFQRRFL
jgi:hypothetical protein